MSKKQSAGYLSNAELRNMTKQGKVFEEKLKKELADYAASSVSRLAAASEYMNAFAEDQLSQPDETVMKAVNEDAEQAADEFMRVINALDALDVSQVEAPVNKQGNMGSYIGATAVRRVAKVA